MTTDLHAIAQRIAPELLREHGPGITRIDIARDLDRRDDLAHLDDGEAEELLDEIHDLIRTLPYTVTAG